MTNEQRADDFAVQFLLDDSRRGLAYKYSKGIRHADSRMGYAAKMKELIGIVADWTASKGSLYELYDAIHKKDVESGI